MRRDYRELNDLDLVRRTNDGSGITVINTALPPEVLQQADVVDEDGRGELEAAARG